MAQEAPAATATAAAPAPMTATTPPADGFGNAAPVRPLPPYSPRRRPISIAPRVLRCVKRRFGANDRRSRRAWRRHAGGGGAPQQGQLALGAPACVRSRRELAASAASPAAGAHEQEPATDESVADGVLPRACRGSTGQVRPTTLTVDSGIAQDEVQRVMMRRRPASPRLLPDGPQRRSVDAWHRRVARAGRQAGRGHRRDGDGRRCLAVHASAWKAS